MKIHQSIIIFQFLVFANNLFCQADDTIRQVVACDSYVNFNVVWTEKNYGTIYWQSSFDGNSWTNIDTNNQRTYRYLINKPTYLRAKVISGTCKPYYSKIIFVDVINMRVLKFDSVTDNSAIIYYYIEKNKSIISECGLFVDTLKVGINSLNIRDTSKCDTLVVRLSDLRSGLQYSVCPYVKLIDGNYVLGGIKSFTTIRIKFINRGEFTDTTAKLWYRIYSSDSIKSSGFFMSETYPVNSNSFRYEGSKQDSLFCCLIKGLKPASYYYVLPFVEVGNKFYYDSIQIIKTFSNYDTVKVDTSKFEIKHKIVWNSPSTAKKISSDGIFADYGRVKRYKNSDTLLLVYHGGPNIGDWVNIYFRRSFDNGVTWEPQQCLMKQSDYSDKYWRFCNPEILVLSDGTILISYVANTKGDENNSSIQIISSVDKGETWSKPTIIKVGRCWEPAMVQLPGGEIELFFSSEAKWWPSINGSYIQQEIMRIYSTDNGKTWSFPMTVAYYPYKRDGMPVPLVLMGNKGVVFAIETVNNNNSPYIIHRGLNESWTLTQNNFDNSPHRWWAGYFDGHGGAPYIVQLYSGETVLSVHRYRGGDWQQNNDMKVMIGDNNAKNFEQLTTPYLLPMGQGAINNSLFVKDSTTIVAISCRRFEDGTAAIYWLEGVVVPK